MREGFTQVQCQKLIGAMAMYFLFWDEPTGLSKQTQAVFETHRARLDHYRNSVINGSKNCPKSDGETDAGIQGQTGRQPAETWESGTHPDGNPDSPLGGGSGTHNSKQ